MSSLLFDSFRVLGLVSDDGNCPPFCMDIGRTTFVWTSVGRAFHLYNGDKLELRLASSPNLDSRIRAICATTKLTLTADKDKITIWGKMTKLAILPAPGVINMITMGENTLVTLDCKRRLKVWDLRPVRRRLARKKADGDVPPMTLEQPVRKLSLQNKKKKAKSLLATTATTLVHPPTYLNKVLVAFEKKLELWNINTGTRIFEFEPFGADILTVQADSPVLDVVAIGLSDGRIVLFNLKAAREICTLRHSGGAVTALVFRGNLLVSGGKDGVLSVWNLDDRKMASTLPRAHGGAISRLHFYQDNEAILLSAGSDNTIKKWEVSPEGRIELHSHRAGHSSPPDLVRPYDDTWVLTSGSDRSLRLMSLARDRQAWELSQGHVQRRAKRKRCGEERLPRIVEFCASRRRAKQWGNLISCHEGGDARVWSVLKKKLTSLELTAPGPARDPATCCALSRCGHYGYVGRSSGLVHEYTVQNGMRQCAVKPRDEKDPAHGSGVRGIFVSPTNEKIVVVHSNGAVRVYDLGKKRILKKFEVGERVTRVVFAKHSVIFAVVTASLEVLVLDYDTGQIGRKFAGHKNQINDLAFSPDGNLLLTSAQDRTIRVFDLPSATLVDWLRFSHPVTSLRMTPKGDFLLTTHSGKLGVFAWSNKAWFSAFMQSVPSRPIEMDPTPLAAKTARPKSPKPEAKLGTSEEESSDTESSLGEGEEEDAADDPFDPVSVERLQLDHSEMVVTSGKPESYWRGILDWEEVQKRNQPKAPPKKDKKAPFFLPNFDDEQPLAGEAFFADGGMLPEPKKKRRKVEEVTEDTELTDAAAIAPLLLEEEQCPRNDKKIHEALLKLGPSQTDLEIRGLGAALFPFLGFLSRELESKAPHFEMLHAWLGATLRIHGDTIRERVTEDDELRATVDGLHGAARGSVHGFEGLLFSCRAQAKSMLGVG